jgi:hypothetical protein
MRRKIIFLCLAVGAVAILVVLVRFLLTSQSPKQGVLKVSANTRARVFLENREIGKTPLETKVDKGEYTVKLVPDGATTAYSTWQGRVVIGTNILTYINRDLSDSELTSAGEMLWLEKGMGNKAELAVISVPDGANVVLDDQSKGVTPISLTDLTIGDHNLVITSPGFEPRTVKVKLTSGYKLNASIALALSPSQIAAQEADDSTVAATPSATLATTPTPTKSKLPVTDKPKSVKIDATPTGFLRVRKEASTAADEVARVKPGETYPVLDIQVEGSTIRWYKIDLGDSKSGWISAEYAEKVQ